ncbi:hypothetical protein MLD38_000773 [Melastoma candidum]|uniref:Uncharacterized protein n=1 Tax=Melastoma candidum TaxID=119954 RepID=A0ACB9SD50_9MYRT|nr:hypothetical protein MLD38_000773 [Melastoma candidum]
MLTPAEYELPDCHLLESPSLIVPISPTPNHTLRLSNLDDQKFLRFSIKYLYLYQQSVPAETLKHHLSRVLVDYYPLAGRLREDPGYERKLMVDCNGKGAVFAEAFMDATVGEFLESSDRPNKSWRKLLYRVDSDSFLGVPPLVVQVTNLRCGGMILCTAICHCLCDGIGTSQFLRAWAHSTTTTTEIPVLPSPSHPRHVFQSRSPPHPTSPTPAYTRTNPNHHPRLPAFLQSHHPLVPVSATFTAPDLLLLKKRCCPSSSLKFTSFEALAAHTWLSWVRSLSPPPHLKVKLLFSINVRGRIPSSPPDAGFYGNAFVLACAQAAARDLTDSIGLGDAARLVQRAKDAVDEEYVRSVVDLLEDESAGTDMGASLVITQWARLGLEEVDFGRGRPLHMGPLSSDIYCVFLPVAGDARAVRVLVSVPAFCAGKFKSYMSDYSIITGDGDGNGNVIDDG